MPSRIRARARRRTRRPGSPLRALLAVVLILVLLTGVAGALAYRSERNLQATLTAQFRSGQLAAEQGKALLKEAASSQNPALLTQAEADLNLSERYFELAGV
ncbi:MAG TPA: hypothetical protein VNL71_17465, partial [Chloroflexota bacterium]|nr:hypothetical protein [Chloroflexota bacterium]